MGTFTSVCGRFSDGLVLSFCAYDMKLVSGRDPQRTSGVDPIEPDTRRVANGL